MPKRSVRVDAHKVVINLRFGTNRFHIIPPFALTFKTLDSFANSLRNETVFLPFHVPRIYYVFYNLIGPQIF